MIHSAFISNYRGQSDYYVEGLPGRVHVRACSAVSQAFYGEFDPQKLGIVVNGLDPVPDDVLAHFNASTQAIHQLHPDLFVPALVTAKWYRHIGWVRCEP